MRAWEIHMRRAGGSFRIVCGALATCTAICVLTLSVARASAAGTQAEQSRFGSWQLAQAGSAGGTIGKQDKGASGGEAEAPKHEERRATHEERRSTREERRSSHEARTPRRSATREGGGNFDGVWATVAAGQSCSGMSSGSTTISGGNISGAGVTGSVSRSGAVHGVSSANGVVSVFTGHLSATSGSGTFRRSDGCVGHWSAVKR